MDYNRLLKIKWKYKELSFVENCLINNRQDYHIVDYFIEALIVIRMKTINSKNESFELFVNDNQLMYLNSLHLLIVNYEIALNLYISMCENWNSNVYELKKLFKERHFRGRKKQKDIFLNVLRSLNSFQIKNNLNKNNRLKDIVYVLDEKYKTKLRRIYNYVHRFCSLFCKHSHGEDIEGIELDFVINKKKLFHKLSDIFYEIVGMLNNLDKSLVEGVEQDFFRLKDILNYKGLSFKNCSKYKDRIDGRGCFALFISKKSKLFSLSGIFDYDYYAIKRSFFYNDIKDHTDFMLGMSKIKTMLGNSFEFAPLDDNNLRYVKCSKKKFEKLPTPIYLSHDPCTDPDVYMDLYSCCERKIHGKLNNKTDIEGTYIIRWMPCEKCVDAMCSQHKIIILYLYKDYKEMEIKLKDNKCEIRQARMKLMLC